MLRATRPLSSGSSDGFRAATTAVLIGAAIDYGAKVAAYVGVFMAAINWPAIERLYAGVSK
jgi:hypothetical protein